MRKTEQKLWDRFSAARQRLYPMLGVQDSAYGPRLERIENALAAGHPDVDCMFRGQFSSIELKAVEAFPARALSRVFTGGAALSKEQLNWHMSFRRHQGRSYILAGVGSKQYLIEGHLADEFNGWNKEQLEAASVAEYWVDIFSRLEKK